MIIIFIVLILAFAVLAVVFVWKNDFAEETIEILFPAVGAIVFSLYLGINTIYIKKPEAKKIETPIGILLNSTEGKLYSLTNLRNMEDSFEFHNYLKAIGEIESYPSRKIWKDSVQFELLLGEENPMDSDKLDNFIKENIAYSFWEWLTEAPQSYHTQDYSSIKGISGIVGFANYDSMERIKIPFHEESILFKISPTNTTLPQRSKIIFKDSIYKIETPYSNITVQFSRRGNGYTGVFNNLSKRIFEMNKINYQSEKLSFHTYEIKINYEVKPFKRFSKKAKREKEWIERLEKQLIQDYSWEVIRNKFKEMN